MAKGFVPIKDLAGLGLKNLNDYLSYLYLATKNVAEKDIRPGVGNKIDISQNPALNHSGEVTSAGGGVTTIAAKAVTMAKIQDIATAVMLGRVTSEIGITEQLTVAQVRTLLTDLTNRFVTDAQITEWTAKQAALGFIPENSINKGQYNGYAGLDALGKVPVAYLPSYVDDVIEAANLAAFPAIGEADKIYVAIDTNVTYRWSGSAYTEISASIALGMTSATAFRGDYGNTAYLHSQAAHAPVGATVNDTDVNLKNRANHTGTQLAITISDFASTVGSTVLTGLSTVTNAVIAATDTVLSALGKLQKQITDNLVSPALTGTPTAPTPATADNSTTIATTAFVKNQGYTTSAGSGVKITVGTVAPTTPSPGDFWYQVI